MARCGVVWCGLEDGGKGDGDDDGLGGARWVRGRGGIL